MLLGEKWMEVKEVGNVLVYAKAAAAESFGGRLGVKGKGEGVERD
jgi:hypothetical protein